MPGNAPIDTAYTSDLFSWYAAFRRGLGERHQEVRIRFGTRLGVGPCRANVLALILARVIGGEASAG